MNILTKTDFIQYLTCPSSLWLKKNKEKTYEKYKGELDDFLQRLIKDGYEVEDYALKLFPNGEEIVETFNKKIDSVETEKVLKNSLSKVFFQASFLTIDGYFARADILEKNNDGSWNIYEVKSSTSIKKDKKHNHLKDVVFQKLILEKMGLKIKNCSIIHLDKKFKKHGEVLASELLTIIDVNEEVAEIFLNTKYEIESALKFIARQKINENMCECWEKTRSNHCDTFIYFNKNYDDKNIHNLNRISQKKVIELLKMGVEKIEDVPDDYELNEKQLLQKHSWDISQAIIDEKNIEKTLKKLIFPLYFFDYETIPSAIPKVENFSPHQHLPFQFSLHILRENGELEHEEFLAEKFEAPEKLILFMKEVIGNSGNLISWYASFEKTQNKKMIEMFPEHETFLREINDRTFDLMDIFQLYYVDSKFKGSTSIKKVLPVLCPDLSYSEMEVSNGAAAIEQGEKMLSLKNGTEREEIRKNLLKYCELDTFAMVEIYKFLKNKI